MRGGGDPEGNERLTAAIAVALVVLPLVEGATILRIGQLLRIHMFVGMLLVPVVVLKLASSRASRSRSRRRRSTTAGSSSRRAAPRRAHLQPPPS